MSSQNNRTKLEQEKVENLIISILTSIANEPLTTEDSEKFENNIQKASILQKELHAKYLLKNLTKLQYNIRWYDTGHPWVLYWITNALILLDLPYYSIKQYNKEIVQFLQYCQPFPYNGFSGGHYQMSNVASTYAAVMTLVNVGTEEAYNLIDRKGLYNFFMKVKHKKNKGSFVICEEGEEDMRALYVVVILAKLLKLDTDELLEGVGDYVASCQTYEGGIASNKYVEAHGGLTYCGLAALCCLDQTNKLNLQRLIHWAVKRQLDKEGGFNGRTNKVVDACYTFWVGSIFNLLNLSTNNACVYEHRQLYSQMNLQIYVLLCCQYHTGGLIDKPGKPVDLYHTCYSLCGLSCSQFLYDTDKKFNFYETNENTLVEIDPIYNVEKSKLQQAKEYFSKFDKIEP